MTAELIQLIEEFKGKVNELPPADKQAVLDELDDWLGDELHEPTDPDGDEDDDDWDEDSETD